MNSLIAIISVTIIVVTAIVIVNSFIHRQRMLWQIALYSALVFVGFFIIATVPNFFYKASWEDFFFILLLGLGASVLTALATYFNIQFVRWKARKLREKYSELPDGPKKERLMEMLKKIERHQNVQQ